MLDALIFKSLNYIYENIVIILIFVIILLVFTLLIPQLSGNKQEENNDNYKLVVEEQFSNVVPNSELELINLQYNPSSVTEIMEETNMNLCDLNVSNEVKNKMCSALTRSSCNRNKCCVFLENKDKTGKCRVGNSSGPITNVLLKNDMNNVDFYYYMNKKVKI